MWSSPVTLRGWMPRTGCGMGIGLFGALSPRVAPLCPEAVTRWFLSVVPPPCAHAGEAEGLQTLVHHSVHHPSHLVEGGGRAVENG